MLFACIHCSMMVSNCAYFAWYGLVNSILKSPEVMTVGAAPAVRDERLARSAPPRMAAPSTTVSEARPHIRHRAVMRHSEVGDGGLGREVRRLRRAVGPHAPPRRPARAAAGP